MEEHQKRLQLFSQFSEENQLRLSNRIKNEILDFKFLLDITEANDSSAFSKQVKNNFEESVKLFEENEDTAFGD